MIRTRTGRRYFHLAWPPWQPPGADGLAAIVAPTASTAWADGLLARDQERLLVWAATSIEPETQALARLCYQGVRAVTLVPARSDPRWVRLALDVACQLSTGRSSGAAGAACLTSWVAPRPPAGVVRIPHLVSVARDDSVTDAVVWELAPRAAAAQWLGGPLPDQAFFEEHLDGLLRLRAAARRCQLPARATAAGLAELLSGRELSIKLVYQYPDLFRGLLAGRSGISRPATGGLPPAIPAPRTR